MLLSGSASIRAKNEASSRIPKKAAAQTCVQQPFVFIRSSSFLTAHNHLDEDANNGNEHKQAKHFCRRSKILANQ